MLSSNMETEIMSVDGRSFTEGCYCKLRKIHMKTPVLMFAFHKVAGL